MRLKVFLELFLSKTQCWTCPVMWYLSLTSGHDRFFFVAGTKQKNNLWGDSKIILPLCCAKRFLSLSNALKHPGGFCCKVPVPSACGVGALPRVGLWGQPGLASPHSWLVPQTPSILAWPELSLDYLLILGNLLPPLTCDGPFCRINSCLGSGTGWMLFPTSSCLHPQHSPWCLFGFQTCVQMYREYISEPSWYASSLGLEQLKITVGQKNSGSFILKRPVTHIHLVSECTQCVKTWLCIMCVTWKVIRWFDCFKAS